MRGHHRRRATKRLPATSMRPKGFGGARAFAALALLDDGSHQLRRAAWHLPLRRSERGLLYFYHELLVAIATITTASAVYGEISSLSYSSAFQLRPFIRRRKNPAGLREMRSISNSKRNTTRLLGRLAADSGCFSKIMSLKRGDSTGAGKRAAIKLRRVEAPGVAVRGGQMEKTSSLDPKPNSSLHYGFLICQSLAFFKKFWATQKAKLRSLLRR